MTDVRRFCIGVFALLCVGACKSDSAGNKGSTGGGAGTGPVSAVATIAGFSGGTVSGTATFTQNAIGDVTVSLMLTNCPDGPHPMHIHQGTACDTADTQGAHWDMTRGEGIPDIVCSAGVGMSSYTRTAGLGPTLIWSIGGPATTNVIGHAFVIHGDMAARIGCGVIVGR